MRMRIIIGAMCAAIASVPSPAIAQTDVVVCARNGGVNIRESIVIPSGQDPLITIERYPFLSRAVIGVVPDGGCVKVNPNKRNLLYQGGYQWINVVTLSGEGGWAAKDFLDFQLVGTSDF